MTACERNGKTEWRTISSPRYILKSSGLWYLPVIIISRRYEVRWHTKNLHLTQPGHESAKLNECADALQNPHVREPNLFDVLQLCVLRYPVRDNNRTSQSISRVTFWEEAKVHLLVECFGYSEYGYDDVHRAVTLVPELAQLLHRGFYVTLCTCPNDRLDDYGMGLVTDFENVISGYETKARVCGLEVVDCLSHVPFGGKYQCRQPIVVVFDLPQKRTYWAYMQEEKEGGGGPSQIRKSPIVVSKFRHLVASRTSV